MNRLEIERKKINKIDIQIVKLFESRMNSIKKIASFKKKNKMQLVDKNREKKLFLQNTKALNNKAFLEYYKIIFNAYLTASKKMQKKMIE